GITAMSKLREKSNLPVILLTAKGEDTDKILGLNVGADDYVTKPFNPVELIARVKAQLRRYMTLGGSNTTEKKDVYMVSGIILDDKSKQVVVDGEEVSLTPTEYYILKLFMENPGKVYSPKDIYKEVWKDIPLGSEGTVAVHIRHLREKIEINPSEPRYLKVVWGQGYKMEE
ncbi:MAG: response regulator transcription factor, partial [Lachnospiraceae bacterium]|nr:response regulator transcription factor [Lachnospiraceae bacterium]